MPFPPGTLVGQKKRAPKQKLSFDLCNHEMSNDSSNILQAGSSKSQDRLSSCPRVFSDSFELDQRAVVIIVISKSAFHKESEGLVPSQGECDTLVLAECRESMQRTNDKVPPLDAFQ